MIGLIILSGLKKDDDEYTGGKILDPDNGKVCSSKLQLTDGGPTAQRARPRWRIDAGPFADLGPGVDARNFVASECPLRFTKDHPLQAAPIHDKHAAVIYLYHPLMAEFLQHLVHRLARRTYHGGKLRLRETSHQQFG